MSDVLAIGRSLPPPSRPIERSFTARSALWINSHPKSSFLALCALAAGYGLVLGLVPMSQDVFISVTTVGGVTLLVSAYALKRLIYMPPLVRAKLLLGLKAFTGYEQVYFVGKDTLVHVLKFNTTVDPNQLGISMDEEGRKLLGLLPSREENRSQTNSQASLGYLSWLSEDSLARLSETMKTNGGRTHEQMLELALGGPCPASREFNIRTHNGVYTVKVRQVEVDGKTSFEIDLPRALVQQIPDLAADSSDRQIHYLIEATNINLPLVNFLRTATKETI